jgi:hypothetical protein
LWLHRRRRRKTPRLQPDGVSGFADFLDTGLFSKFSLLTGALPAQYGLHSTGILDITTKSGAALSGGSVSVYGGSNSAITPSFEYGGVSGNSEYFVTGRLRRPFLPTHPFAPICGFSGRQDIAAVS